MMIKTERISPIANNVVYSGNWTGGILPSVITAVQIESASNIEYTSFTFGNYSNDGLNNGGNILYKDTANLIVGVDYFYDYRLNLIDTEPKNVNIMDVNTIGALDTGKYIRVVEINKNIAQTEYPNIGDPGLKIYAKDSEDISKWIPPDKDSCFIDPARGKGLLPGPYYFCKCSDIDNLMSPEIKYQNVDRFDIKEFTGCLTPYVAEGRMNSIKFTKGVFKKIFVPTTTTPKMQKHKSIYTFNKNNPLNWSRGTISVWAKVVNAISGTGTTDAEITFFNIPYLFQLSLKQNLIQIYNNNAVVSSNATDLSATAHIYIVWDIDKTLNSGASTMQVFINNVAVINYAGVLPGILEMLEFQLGLNNFVDLASGSGSSLVAFSNLKIYNHVVSGDPSWAYVGGTGDEDGLHAMFTLGNGRKPALTLTTNSGVGYFRKTDITNLWQNDVENSPTADLLYYKIPNTDAKVTITI